MILFKLTRHLLLLILLLVPVKYLHAKEFNDCITSDRGNESVCLDKVFQEKVLSSEFDEINKWLMLHSEGIAIPYVGLFSTLICGGEGSSLLKPPYGINKPFSRKSRNEVMKLAGYLIEKSEPNVREWALWSVGPMSIVSYMAPQSIVTVMFCLSNRGDSEVLNYVLTKAKVTAYELNESHYEGRSLPHVPLYRAVMNNDLKSVEVLLQHGASPNLTKRFETDTTPLKTALKNKNIEIANRLLDRGASVHVKGAGYTCRNGEKIQSALDLALEIPKIMEGRDQVISRIEGLLESTSDLSICQE